MKHELSNILYEAGVCYMTNYMWEQVYNLIHDMGGKDVLLNVVHERNEVLHTLLYGGIYVLYNIHSRGQWCTILYTM